MKDIEDKRLKQAEWTQQHTLTREQTKQLILNKLKRAEAMHNAQNRREMSLQRHR
jgi:hypothetical protein